MATQFTVDTEALQFFVYFIVSDALLCCLIVVFAKLKKLVTCPALENIGAHLNALKNCLSAVPDNARSVKNAFYLQIRKRI